MKSNKIQISLRVSKDCHDAMVFLRSKNISPDKYLREGGEPLVLQISQKNKFTLNKIKLPF